MAKYVDGFVLVVPRDKISEYKKMASEGRDMWIKYGALEYFECMGEDLNPKEMGGEKPLTFTEMTKAKPNEIVWFSFIVFESHQKEEILLTIAQSIMGVLYLEVAQTFPMPLDMKRMAYGGFEVAVEG